jgi:four helix bundle protein
VFNPDGLGPCRLESLDISPANECRFSDDLGNGRIDLRFNAQVLSVEVNEGNLHGRGQKSEVGGRKSDEASFKAAGKFAQIFLEQVMQIKSPRDLTVYKEAYKLAMEVFVLSKNFPAGERYSLTDQLRRSSRSVCANLREAWAKRRYEAHFVSKLTDADGENGETDTWLELAHDCGYLSADKHERLRQINHEIGAMLGRMIQNPSSFILRTPVSDR